MILAGKNVVITGCLKGIGRSTLDLFARQGANIWACSQKKEDAFELHIDQLQEENTVWIKPIYFDFADEIQLKEAVKQIRSDKMVIDSLINIAGMTIDARFHMMSMKDLRQVFEINYFSQLLFTQYITKLMLRQNFGNVVFISSIAGIDGSVGQVSYASSKAAVIALTKSLSAELGPMGIRVNAIAPGVIPTPETYRTFENMAALRNVSPEEIKKQFIASTPMGRLGTLDDVGNCAAFLASDESSYITGQVIGVTGGKDQITNGEVYKAKTK